jgi:hypothetical protein
MFIERVVNSDMHHIETRDSKVGKGALRTLAKEKGYDLVGQQIHWFKLTEVELCLLGLKWFLIMSPLDIAL